MHHFDNLIVGVALMAMLMVFLRSVLNSISPRLGNEVFRGMKKLASLLAGGIAWMFMKLLSLFGVDWTQKKLPGRRT